MAPLLDDYELSDEEVMGLSEDDDDDDEQEDFDEQNRQDISEHDDDAGWGNSRDDYYGADDVENDEDAKLEEEEALRLQQKHLEGLSTEDYYEEDDLAEWKRSAKESIDSEASVVNEQLPDQDPSLLNDSERLNLLEMAFPELLPLAKELTSLNKELPELKKHAGENHVSQIKFSALTAYIGTINAYFALFVNSDKKTPFKNHPVMEGILKAREVWRVAQELDENAPEPTGEELDEDDDEMSMESEQELLSSEEDEDLGALAKPNKRKADSSENFDKGDAEDDDEFNISARIPAKKKLKKRAGAKTDYGEADDLNDIDLEDKEAKKRSLRFYTSKISQESKKQERLGGDDDLPYKERLFERQQRLNEEARRRGEKNNVEDEADNFDDDPNEDDMETSRQLKAGADDDYYNNIKASSDKKKQDKKKSHELAVKAAKEGKLAELQDEVADDSGKRAINFQILKNKGLTPKRNKDNRNSRVKKRKKYAEAQKKLSSTRRVYKEPTTAYGGEQTGIKKNVSRSVKFG